MRHSSDGGGGGKEANHQKKKSLSPNLIRLQSQMPELRALAGRMCERAERTAGQSLVVLEGETGVGKTTTLYRLLGRRVIRLNIMGHIGLPAGEPEDFGHISHGNRSETTEPTLASLPSGLVCFDGPGTFDNRGDVSPHVPMCTSLALPLALRAAKGVRVILFHLNANEVTRPRGGGFRKQVDAFKGLFDQERLAQLSRNSATRHLAFVFTHSGSDPIELTHEKICFQLTEQIAEKKRSIDELSQQSKKIFDRLFKNMPDLSRFSEEITKHSDTAGIIDGVRTELSSKGGYGESITRMTSKTKNGSEGIDEWYATIEKKITLSEEKAFMSIMLASRTAFFVLKSSQDEDDIDRLQMYVSRIQRDLPEQVFSTDLTRRTKEWLFWEELFEHETTKGTALVNRIDHLSSEVNRFKEYKKLRLGIYAKYKSLLKELSSSCLDKVKINEIVTGLIQTNLRLGQHLDSTFGERDRRACHLNNQLKELDNASEVPFDHASLQPVSLDTLEKDSFMKGMKGFGAFLNRLITFPVWLVLAGMRGVAQAAKPGSKAVSFFDAGCKGIHWPALWLEQPARSHTFMYDAGIPFKNVFLTPEETFKPYSNHSSLVRSIPDDVYDAFSENKSTRGRWAYDAKERVLYLPDTTYQTLLGLLDFPDGVYHDSFPYNEILKMPKDKFDQARSMLDHDEDRILLDLGLGSGFGYDPDTKIVNPAKAKFEVTYTRRGNPPVHLDCIVSVRMNIEKRLHPDNVRQIDSLRDTLKFLDACRSMRLDASVRESSKKFESQSGMLEMLSEEPLSTWRDRVTLFIKNRLDEYDAFMSHWQESFLGLLSDMRSDIEIYNETRPTLQMLNRLLSVFHVTDGVRSFLHEHSEPSYQREVESSLTSQSITGVWGRKREPDTQPPYVVVAKKTAGSSIGARYWLPSKTVSRGFRSGSTWFGKIGFAEKAGKGELAQDGATFVRRRSVLISTLEVMLFRLYIALNPEGTYVVPKARLAELDIKNDYTDDNHLTGYLLDMINDGRSQAKQVTKGVFVLSKLMSGYRDLHYFNCSFFVHRVDPCKASPSDTDACYVLLNNKLYYQCASRGVESQEMTGDPETIKSLLIYLGIKEKGDLSIHRTLSQEQFDEIKRRLNHDSAEFDRCHVTHQGLAFGASECFARGFLPDSVDFKGKKVPLVGFEELVAAAILTGDVDFVGGSQKNTGIIFQRTCYEGNEAIKEETGLSEEVISAKIVKVDPGAGLSFFEPENYRTAHEDLRRGPWRSSQKHLQYTISGGNYSCIPWDNLCPTTQQPKIISALEAGLALLQDGSFINAMIHDRAFRMTPSGADINSAREYFSDMPVYLRRIRGIYQDELRPNLHNRRRIGYYRDLFYRNSSTPFSAIDGEEYKPIAFEQ